MKRIGIVGAGTMGCGIAQVIAQADFEVVLRDIKSELIEQAEQNIKKSLDYALEKEKITTTEKEATLAQIDFTTEITDLAEVDLVIEAATENKEIKKEIFKELDQVCQADTILASNTSALSITNLATVTSRPEQVIGIHFFNPVILMELVEIIDGLTTTEETVDLVEEFITAINKQAVRVEEAPGFIVNRLLIPMINEAVFMLDEGLASKEDIDTAMKLGANHPLGPLALADLIGLDVCLAIMETLYEEFSDSKYRPSYLLRKKVRAGKLGKKSGQGFYQY